MEKVYVQPIQNGCCPNGDGNRVNCIKAATLKSTLCVCVNRIHTPQWPVSVIGLLHSNAVTTHLSDANLVWESGASSEFLLQFTIHYPPQSIMYPPPPSPPPLPVYAHHYVLYSTRYPI